MQLTYYFSTCFISSTNNLLGLNRILGGLDTSNVVRMTDECLPKQPLHGELCARKRSQGGKKKRCKDSLKTSLKHYSTDPIA